jgi:hypothetical protein
MSDFTLIDERRYESLDQGNVCETKPVSLKIG